jgi:hypothetical protein
MRFISSESGLINYESPRNSIYQFNQFLYYVFYKIQNNRQIKNRFNDAFADCSNPRLAQQVKPQSLNQPVEMPNFPPISPIYGHHHRLLAHLYLVWL